MRNLIWKMSALLLTVAMCTGLYTDVVVNAQETDVGVMTEETEQEEPVTGRGGGIKSSASELHAPRIVEDSTMEAGQKVTWDCVWFGSYPQSEVVSTNPVYSTLQNASGWDSRNDITIGDRRYRRMKKGDATCATSYDDYYFYYNWPDADTYHYFKYEPVKWRVLKTDESQALLLSDVVLDDQKYNTVYEDVTWENSTIRSWLNGYGSSYNQQGIDYGGRNFIGSAFTSGEQYAIADTSVVNADNLIYGTEGGNDTTDKIFLLSESEVYGESSVSYGFVSDKNTYDEARRSKSSTYAKAMGVRGNTGDTYKDNCYWWLRSPGYYPVKAAHVFDNGYVNYDGFVASHGDYVGVRAALNLNLSSNQWSYAGTVCSDEMASGENGGNTGDDVSAKKNLQCSNACTVEEDSKTSLTAAALYYDDNYDEFKKFTESVTWTSNDPSIATVKSSGFILPTQASDYQMEDGSTKKIWRGTALLTIQGVRKGSTTITGEAPDGVRVTCNVTVSGKQASGEAGSGGSLTLGEDKSGAADKKSGVVQFFPATWSLKSTVFPVEISMKEKEGTYTLKGTVGIRKSDLLKDDDQWSKYKKNVSDASKYTGRYDCLDHFRETYGVKSLTAVTTDKFKKLPKLSVMGYFENTYDKNWNLISNTGKLEADAKWSAGINWQFATPIGPVYLNLGGSGKISGDLGPLYDYSSKTMKIVDGSLKLTPSITLEGGYGIDKVATIGAQGTLSVPITLIPASKGELSAKASLHVKLIFVLDYTHDLATYTKPLWGPDDSKKKTRAQNSSISISEGTLSLMDTSFADRSSAWNGGDSGNRMRKRTSASRALSDHVLMSGVMESTLPMQAEINGKRVLVFQSYDSSRETLNSSVLMYSVYENGVWSEPKAVWDNGYADLYADMKVVGGKLVLAWQKEKAAINGDVSTDSENVLGDFAKNSEICYAVFDEATGTFSEQTYVTNNDSYDMMPRISEDHEDIVLSWVRNDAAEVMQETGVNTIYAARLNGSSFEEEQAVVQAPGTIDDYVLYEEAGKLQTVFAGQSEGISAVFGNDGQVIEELSDLMYFSEEGRTANLDYVNGRIHCFSDGTLYAYTPSTGAVDTFLAGESKFGSEAQYCSNGEKSGYIWSTYNEETGTGSIMASMETGDGYSEPVVLYEKDDMIWRYLSPILTSEGDWQIVANIQDIEENLSSLISIEKPAESRIELMGASFDENDVVNGLTGVDYFITNTGDTEINQVELAVTLENNETIKKTIEVSVLPGESIAGTEYIDLSGIDTAQKAELSLYAENQTDRTNCTATDSVGLSDIAVSGTSTKKDGKVVVTATLSNHGLRDSQTVVHLFSDETKETELNKSETVTLKPQESKQISFTVDETAVKYNDKKAAYLTLYAEVNGGDYREEDNVAYAVLYKETEGTGSGNGDDTITKVPSIKVSGIKLSGISRKIAAGKKIKLIAKITPSNAANKALTWKSSNKKVATVNSKGIVTMKKNSGGKKVTITAIANDSSGVKGAYTIKSMKGSVKKIALSGNKSVKAGKSMKLKAKITSSKGANTKLKWTSNHTKYAKVSSKGVVKAYKKGKGKTVKITAMATDGSGKKAAIKIKIK